jgi:membrane protein
MSTDTASLGRFAGRPGEIPRLGKRDVLLRVKDEMEQDHVGILAAGVAFFGLLSIVPALSALVSLYGLIADPIDVERQVTSLSAVMPGAAREIVGTQLHRLVSAPVGSLSFGLLLSVTLLLWSASTGTNALIEAINLAYDEEETRGFFKLRGLAVVFAAALIVAALVAFGVITALPTALEWTGAPFASQIASWIRWPLLAIAAIVGLALLYRYAPDRDRPRWRWVSWGSVVATVLWIIVSLLFSLYVERFGTYNETYGALAGVVVLMLWLYLSTYAILLGAELNAELEAQTAKDSTVGEPQPMGKRGAVKADVLGRRYV